MKAACDKVGLKQIVRAPTREEHLLDPVLTNIPGATATVLPAIADHKLVTAELTFKVPEQTTITRMVWEFAKADWDKMRDLLSSHSWETWRRCMQTMQPSSSTRLSRNTRISASHNEN